MTFIELGDQLPELPQTPPPLRPDVFDWAQHMNVRMQANAHRDAYGDWRQWNTDDFHVRARSNLERGLSAMQQGDMATAQRCFADAANLAMMMHTQAYILEKP